ERPPQLLVRPVQGVLHGVLRRADDRADLPQAHPLVMTHLEDQPFARRQVEERRVDPVAHLAARQGALGIVVGAVSRLRDREGPAAILPRDRRPGGILRPRRAAAQVIEADVAGDAQNPGLQAALVPEPAERAVEPEEGLLVDVTRLVLRAYGAKRHPEDAP